MELGRGDDAGSRSGELAQAKRALRAEIAERVRGIGAQEARTAAAQLCRRLRALEWVAGARRVALYDALPDEISLAPCLEWLLAEGRPVLLPRVSGRRLEFAPVSSLDELRPGYRGLLEPPAATQGVALRRDDLVLVPGRAFDAAGHRLGRGGGYYDRAIAEAQAPGPRFLGVGYDLQRVAEVPHGPADRRVHGLVTERRFERFSGPAAEGVDTHGGQH